MRGDARARRSRARCAAPIPAWTPPRPTAGRRLLEKAIRERHDFTLETTLGGRTITALLSHLHELQVYDNSADGDPAIGATPRPTLLLHVRGRKVIGPPILDRTPAWARAIVAAARKLARGHAER